MQAPQPNDTALSHFEILRELAQGTYTVVYKARSTHPKLRERPETLRILRSSREAQWFLSVARLNAGLNHRRIPALYLVAQDAGRLYSTRQFIDGDDLQNGIGKGRSIAEVSRIVTDVAGTLDYAHGRGILHGYVHPRHILLQEDGAAWLIGFGEHSPADIIALGNPIHLAPEQFMGGKTTPATDVFALSETVFWLLCGRHPFQESRAADLLSAKRKESLWRGMPTAAVSVLRRGMASESSERYATAGAFAAALDSAARAC